ncbi:hypothetical protein PB01_20530 [Psychrobacillus glaciei]|uniref:Uncharacterized protein n=1 Tax=Psychrobacillus glaciei TaxID=2283160 RepID=A0A5J6SSK1_9BACI|nr:hypothetical protein [Psychrobacillus glaciei]QFG00986.1 hypothetical protein PB01_20530 [Psychrobacillus glaciei]
MYQRKNKTLIVFLTLIILISGFLISGCSQDETEDPNKTVIQKVLELQFTGPDEKFMDLLWNPKYKTVNNGIGENLELSKYLEKVYGGYFTESELDSFMMAFGTSYQSVADFNGYKLSFKEVSIDRSEKIPNRYTFIAKVGYQKNGGEEKTINVEGEVLFSTKEEGKIGRFSYGNDNGFSYILTQ